MKVKETSKIIIATEWFANLAILNLMWLFSSLFIITILPATDALFYTVREMMIGKKNKISSIYFSRLKKNALKTLKRDWIVGFIGCIILVDLWIFQNIVAQTVLIRSLHVAIAVLTCLFFVFTIYLYAVFQCDLVLNTKQNWLLSFYLMAKYPLMSLSLFVATVILIILLLIWPAMAFFFSASLLAYLGTYAVNFSIDRSFIK